jgi:NAD-dependent dihydropyrimidine dehydrogenase PreA subunit
MTYVIALPCVDLLDKTCIDECPVDCIYEGERMLYIHPDECVDCGACEPVCPVEAISFEADVPAQWKASTGSTSSSLTNSAHRAAGPGSARSAGITRSWPHCLPKDKTADPADLGR